MLPNAAYGTNQGSVGYGQPPPAQQEAAYGYEPHHQQHHQQAYTPQNTSDAAGHEYANGIPLYSSDDKPGNTTDNIGGAQYGQPAAGGKGRFVVQGWKDIWAAILFLLFFIAVIAWGMYNYAHYFDWSSDGNGSAFRDDTNDDGRDVDDLKIDKVIIWSAIGIGAGIVCAIISMLFFYCVPKASIIFANVAMIFLTLGLAIWSFVNGIWVSAILLVLVALLRAFVLWTGRRFISFSAVLLKQSARLWKQYPAMTFSNILLQILLAAWGLLLLAIIHPTARRIWVEDSPPVGIIFIVFLFATFTLYWTTQVIFNVSHVITSGVTATWYFCGERNMPSNPTFHSAKRALTTSFGSICFGSLLVAILQTIRAVINVFRRSGDQNFCAAFCFCIIDCILGCIEALLRLFNKFAFVFVAIYGYSYMDAARRVSDHTKRSVFTPLFNDMLVTSTLYIFQLGFAVLMAVAAYFGSGGTVSELQWESMLLATACGFWAGITMWLFFKVVDSAVTAIYVCLADVPEALHVTNPEFAAEFNGEAGHISHPPQSAV